MADEGSLQDKIKVYLERQGCWVLNVAGSGAQKCGTPDILACVHGRFVAFEIKDPDEPADYTGAQRTNIKLINRAGGIGLRVDCICQVREVVEDLADCRNCERACP